MVVVIGLFSLLMDRHYVYEGSICDNDGNTGRRNSNNLNRRIILNFLGGIAGP